MTRSVQPCVYMLANRQRGALYTGVTSNLLQRVAQHKAKLADGFTRRYGIDKLVWYEMHDSMTSAIAREKAIKEWQRVWKIELIENVNAEWSDLYPGLIAAGAHV